MRTIHLGTINSTNTYAKEQASLLPREGITCIYADEQTAGRGRQKRKWFSPPGENLYATFFFQLPAHMPHLTTIGQILALSSAHVLQKHHLSPQIKWPNDLQLSGKKLAGVLCETAFHGSSVDLFLGLGLNINMKKEQLETIDQPATSLLAETNRTWNREKLLQELQVQFERDLEQFKKEGFAPFHAPLNNLLAFRGQTLSLSDGQTTWIGLCDSVTFEGELCLVLPEGKIKTFAAGDVHLLTPP